MLRMTGTIVVTMVLLARAAVGLAALQTVTLEVDGMG